MTQKQQIEEMKKEWKETFPDAIAEDPSYLKPLIKRLTSKGEKFKFLEKEYYCDVEEWHNDTYVVTKRILPIDPVFGSGQLIALGISSLDGTARHDWRDFQKIKNQLVSENCEAFELYPDEDRLIDPSNFFILWCFPKIHRIKVGQLHRYVIDQEEAYAPQRKLG